MQDDSGEPTPRRALEAAEQVGEDLAERGARQVHRHCEPGGEERAERVAGEQQARHGRSATDPRETVDGDHRPERYRRRPGKLRAVRGAPCV